ncbi:hypothetical protein [Methylomonas methanica]|uniref:Transposase n=1 Tax=Methylomonas methanica (strain DSM 25384 / MC09) TaxID=857087 RepID=F9ZWQ6_METMM|nr:hypothetical protein [Methylomonas methanica]AEG00903.1 hypothetical protein Metme_2512 [Methylomonas methanica MC09]
MTVVFALIWRNACRLPPYEGGGRPDYRRYRVPGETYYFTVNLLERRLDTLVRCIDVLSDAVRVAKRERLFHLMA